MAAEMIGEYAQRQVTVVTKNAKPILDTATGTEYTSMYKAGQALAPLVAGDPKNRLVWFAVQRAFPGRFQTRDLETGAWVPLKAAARKPRTPTLVASQAADVVAAAITTKDSKAATQGASVTSTPIALAKTKASRAKTTKKNAKASTQMKSSGRKAKGASGSSRARRIA